MKTVDTFACVAFYILAMMLALFKSELAGFFMAMSCWYRIEMLSNELTRK
jgi:hypothetical protein